MLKKPNIEANKSACLYFNVVSLFGVSNKAIAPKLLPINPAKYIAVNDVMNIPVKLKFKRNIL